MKIHIKEVGHVNEGSLLCQNIQGKDDTKSIEVSYISFEDYDKNSICLNLMMLNDEIIQNKMEDLINSLKAFEFTFHHLFIVIDNRNKYEDTLCEESGSKKLIDMLSDENIISKDCSIRVDKLEYKTKKLEYKKMLMQIFSFPDIDSVHVEATYKNAFAYYYSLFNSPTPYMFHLDIPRKGRSIYMKANNEIQTNHYISKCMYLLETYDKVCFVGLLANNDKFIEHPMYSNQYVAYFDNKMQISLQCWVCDTKRWSPKSDRYNHMLYGFQTENAISSNMRSHNKTSLALLSNESSVHKCSY